ncbi:unnamed protein product, partial [Staurois parvus]
IGRGGWRTLSGGQWRDWQRGVEDTEWRSVEDWQRGVEDTEWRPVEGLEQEGGGGDGAVGKVNESGSRIQDGLKRGIACGEAGQ